MNEIPVFSAAAFTRNADRIHKIVEQQKMVSLSTSVNNLPLCLGENLIRLSVMDPLANSRERIALPDTPNNVTWSLSWGEWVSTPKCFEEGWLIVLNDDWVYFVDPPVLVLSRAEYWLN